MIMAAISTGFLFFLLVIGLSQALWANIPEDAEKEIVTIRFLSSRSDLDDKRTLHFQAFDKNYKYILKPVPENETFSSDFKMYRTEKEKFDGIRLTEIDKEEHEDKGQFYVAETELTSLYITQDNNIHGLLNEELRVVPAYDNRSHIIYRVPQSKSQAYKNDMVMAPIDSNEFKQLRYSIRQKRQVPSKKNFYIKLFVVVDTFNTLAMNSSNKTIRQYVGVFWNAVQKMYDSIKSPVIKIQISKLVTLVPSDNFYVNKNPRKYLNKHSVLNKFHAWVKRLPIQSDAYILHLGLNAGGVYGLAYISTACQINRKNIGYFKDKLPYFTGIETAAHELGHILGANHDDYTMCYKDTTYIMALRYTEATQNSWAFSSCSAEQIHYYLSSPAGSCTWNFTAQEDVKLDPNLPGRLIWDRDLQCQSKYNGSFSKWVDYPKEPCLKLWCTDGKNWIGHFPPLDGTTCGWQKICEGGSCVDDNLPDLHEQCGKGYFAKTWDETVCQQIRCVSHNGKVKIEKPALPGSSCGRNGICANLKCQGQLPSYNELCEKLLSGSKPFHNRRRRCARPLKCIIRTTGEIRERNHYLIPDYTDCDVDKVCISGSCVRHY